MKDNETTLFTPFRLGDLLLTNRIAMAPMTRNRAVGQLPCALSVEFYRQRASAGLIITEACHVNPFGQGYIDTPGIYSAKQVLAWSQVVDAVHAAGGHIVLQLSHAGRVTHSSLLPDGKPPVSSVACPAQAITLTAHGYDQVSPPRALLDEEIPGLVFDYVEAALNAMRAGFDAVEIHAGNGYLLDQFLRDSINTRPGPYGGNVANRCRLLLQIAEAVSETVGSTRVGVRLSPMCTPHDTPRDSDPQGLYDYLIERLSTLGLAYVHMIEGETCGEREPEGAPAFDYASLRRKFGGAWIVNNGYQRETAMQAVASGAADLVSFARLFISNPDLVDRFKRGAELAVTDFDTVVGGGRHGYVDYPSLDASANTTVVHPGPATWLRKR